MIFLFSRMAGVPGFVARGIFEKFLQIYTLNLDRCIVALSVLDRWSATGFCATSHQLNVLRSHLVGFLRGGVFKRRGWLGNLKDSVWEDWGTLQKTSGHLHLASKPLQRSGDGWIWSSVAAGASWEVFEWMTHQRVMKNIFISKEVFEAYLGGGFKYFLFSPPTFGEDDQFDEYFSNGLKPPTSSTKGDEKIFISIEVFEAYLGGGNSNIFIFTPEPWEDDPIWLVFFKGVETTN